MIKLRNESKSNTIIIIECRRLVQPGIVCFAAVFLSFIIIIIIIIPSYR